MKNFLLHCSFFFAVHTISYGQGMIVNELSNGAAGNREYIELLVVGSTAAPTAPVDLSGWVLDDNNGSFAGTGTGVGVAAGHFRIAPGCLTNVAPGSIILIYNANEKDGSITLADDPTDANGDKVYVIPHNNTCLQVCTSSPTTSSTSYTGCTYVATTLTGTTSWTAISFANGGDAVQVRRPDYSFYHGFAYGTVPSPFPTFPAAFGGGNSFNAGAGGAGSSFSLGCANWASSGNYTQSTSSAVFTPGVANNANNSILIQNVKSGTFDYTNLSNPNNCLLLLALQLTDFQAQHHEYSNLLSWTIGNPAELNYVVVEQSTNGMDFHDLGSVYAESAEQTAYSFMDVQPSFLTYYRLRMHNLNGDIEYSPIRAVRNTHKNLENVLVYPNPIQNQLNLEFPQILQDEAQLSIINTLGQVVFQQTIAQQISFLQVDMAHLEKGQYTLRIQTSQSGILRKIIK